MAIYQIKVLGQVDRSWSDWLDGMEVLNEVDQNGCQMTTFTGCIIDQAALRGVLNHLWDLNLIVLSVDLID